MGTGRPVRGHWLPSRREMTLAWLILTGLGQDPLGRGEGPGTKPWGLPTTKPLLGELGAVRRA